MNGIMGLRAGGNQRALGTRERDLRHGKSKDSDRRSDDRLRHKEREDKGRT